MTIKITAILHGQDESNGDYFHRVLWPYQALAEHAYIEVVQMTHPDVYLKAAQADLLIVHMIADVGLLEIVKHRKNNNRPTITEISDDFQNFPAETMLHHFYAQIENQQCMIEFIENSIAVQFSSPFLEQKYKAYNKNTNVFMNQLWKIDLPKTKEIGTPLRLGWVGSGGHVLDARELSTFLSQCPALQKFKFSVMTTHEIASIFKNAGLNVAHHPTGDFDTYLRFISSLDVGIAHILEEDFALGRSDGKYLEYTTQGVVSVCANRGTFEKTIRPSENGFLYNSAEDLQNILECISSNPKIISTIRSQAYTDVQQNRNHLSMAMQKISWYQSFIESKQDVTPQLLFETHEIEEDLKALLEEHNYHPHPDLLNRYKKIAKICPQSHYVWQGLYLLATQFNWKKETKMFEGMLERTQNEALQRALDWKSS